MNDRPDTETAGPRRKAVTVGSATVDIITVIADRDIERVTMANVTASFLLIEQGRKLEAESITIHPGGGALNTAVCLTRQGYEVAPIVKLGEDLNAVQILQTFEKEGLSTALVRRTDKLNSGIGVMISSHDRNATIFTYRGANTLIDADDVPSEAFAGTDLVHVSGLSNKSADQFAHIVGSARRAGAFVSANPGIRQLTARREAFLASMGDIDLLSINRVEAEALMPALAARAEEAGGGTVDAPLPDDAPPLMRRGLSGSGFDMSLEGFCAALHEAGVGYVTVTDGTDGAYLSARGALYFCPPLAVEPAGTAGAGDAFTGTLASRLAAGTPPDLALSAASANAASVVSHIDTQSGLLGPVALDRLLQSAPEDFESRRLI